ncbi:heterogeneous nuclear ribonucleoprotein K, partial [Clonorchis sinensis]
AAGVIIGKGGENIQRIREEYSVKVMIPDSNGPERVLVLDGDLGSVLEIFVENLERMQNNRDEGVDLRLLVHQSQAGCIIGRGGYKIKELREQSGLQTLKVYQMLCPGSTDRVIQLVGDLDKVVDCLQAIAELLEGAPPKGSRQNYDARDADESIAADYGGWGVGNQNAALGLVQRRNNLSTAAYGQNNVLAAGLFGGGGTGVTVAGRTGGQAAAVTQALASSLPHASAAAMLAATGGQTAGGPNAGPAGDAAAAAAMMAAGLMRGLPNRVAMNFLTPTTTTQVSVSNKMIGAIMGRAGVRINQVRQESNADIKISRQEPGVEDRIITITGTPEQIQNAQFLLQMWKILVSCSSSTNPIPDLERAGWLNLIAYTVTVGIRTQWLRVPPLTTEEELRNFFAVFGTIKDVKVIYDKSGLSKGSYAFVTFEDQETAEAIIKNEAETLVFKDRKLNIGYAVRKQPALIYPTTVMIPSNISPHEFCATALGGTPILTTSNTAINTHDRPNEAGSGSIQINGLLLTPALSAAAPTSNQCGTSYVPTAHTRVIQPANSRWKCDTTSTVDQLGKTEFRCAGHGVPSCPNYLTNEIRPYSQSQVSACAANDTIMTLAKTSVPKAKSYSACTTNLAPGRTANPNTGEVRMQSILDNPMIDQLAGRYLLPRNNTQPHATFDNPPTITTMSPGSASSTVTPKQLPGFNCCAASPSLRNRAPCMLNQGQQKIRLTETNGQVSFLNSIRVPVRTCVLPEGCKYRPEVPIGCVHQAGTETQLCHTVRNNLRIRKAPDIQCHRVVYTYQPTFRISVTNLEGGDLKTQRPSSVFFTPVDQQTMRTPHREFRPTPVYQCAECNRDKGISDDVLRDQSLSSACCSQVSLQAAVNRTPTSSSERVVTDSSVAFERPGTDGSVDRSVQQTFCAPNSYYPIGSRRVALSNTLSEGNQPSLRNQLSAGTNTAGISQEIADPTRTSFISPSEQKLGDSFDVTRNTRIVEDSTQCILNNIIVSEESTSPKPMNDGLCNLMLPFLFEASSSPRQFSPQRTDSRPLRAEDLSESGPFYPLQNNDNLSGKPLLDTSSILSTTSACGDISKPRTV